MNRKGTLSLLEQSIMLLVFAAAAALCLKGFLAAELTARGNEALDAAVVCARNVAEQLKHTKGEWDAAEVDGSETWRVSVKRLDTGLPTLGKAEVTVVGEDGTVLFSIPAAWQEVDGCEA